MIDINEYIKNSKEYRQKHLQLDSDCIMRGGQSMYLKGLLAHILDTSIPSGKKILVCHACHNELCSNPNHIYWGTPSDNALDARANGKKTLWEYMIIKYGEETARNMQHRSKEVAAKGGKGNKGKTKTPDHKEKISNAISNQVCYTDGNINIKQNKDLPMPYGFHKGMSRKKTPL